MEAETGRADRLNILKLSRNPLRLCSCAAIWSREGARGKIIIMRAVRLLTLACMLAAFRIQPVLAQEGQDSYPASFFAANQPATAYEMVTLLPGFHIQLGD